MGRNAHARAAGINVPQGAGYNLSGLFNQNAGGFRDRLTGLAALAAWTGGTASRTEGTTA